MALTLKIRTKLQCTLLAALISLSHAGQAAAQNTSTSAGDPWPARPIRMIAPISAGGGADVAARLLAKSLTETLQQQVIVDNRPGGGSVPGTAAAANATPDGYTILWISGAHAINAGWRCSSSTQSSTW